MWDLLHLFSGKTPIPFKLSKQYLNRMWSTNNYEWGPAVFCRGHLQLTVHLHFSFQNKWISRSPMLQRRVYHSMAAVQRKLYVLGGNDLDYNNDRILVRHIDSYNIDTDQWTRCNFNLLTGKYPWLSKSGAGRDSGSWQTCFHRHLEGSSKY